MENVRELYEYASMDVATQGSEAHARVYTVALAAVATIRSKLARAIVFGCTTGERVAKLLQPRVEPHLRGVVAQEYHPRLPQVRLLPLRPSAIVIGGCLSAESRAGV